MSKYYVDSGGGVVEAKSPEDVQTYTTLGYAPADEAALTRHELKKAYGGWRTALFTGLVNAIPGARAGVIGAQGYFGGQAAAQEASDAFTTAETEHPYLTGATQAVGIAGQAVGAALLLPVAGAAGAASVAGRALATAGAGALAGVGNTLDENAVEYAKTPAGGERLYAELSNGTLAKDLGFGAVKGAGTMLLLAGAGNLVGRGAKALTGKAAAASQSLQQVAANLEAKNAIRAEAAAAINSLPKGQQIMEYAKEKNLFTMSPGNRAAFLKDEYKRADGLIKNAVNGTDSHMTVGETYAFASDLLKDVKGLNRAIASKIEKALNKPNIDAKNLLGLRVELDRNILNHNPGPRTAFQLRMDSVRDKITGQIDDLLQRSGDPELQKLFAEGNRVAHASQTLQRAAQNNPETSIVAQLFRMGAGYAGGPAGALAGALTDGTLVKSGRAGAAFTAKMLSKALDNFDGRLADSVVSRLGGGKLAANAQIAKNIGEAELMPAAMYAHVAPVAQNWQNQPQVAIQSYVQDLESRGVPGQVIDATLPQHMAAMQLLAEKVPQSPVAGQLAVPEEHKPSYAEQRKFMEYANAVANPMHAVRNMGPVQREVLQRVYPQMLRKVTESVGDLAATRPQMAGPARRWVGSTLGMPASGADLPQVRQMLRLNQQMQQMKMQQMQQGPRGGAIGGVQAPPASRTERMSR